MRLSVEMDALTAARGGTPAKRLRDNPWKCGQGEGRGAALSGDTGDKRTEKVIIRCLKYIHRYQE